jgi:secreted trypsin-like serine protease
MCSTLRSTASRYQAYINFSFLCCIIPKTLHLARYVSFPHTLESDSAGRKRHKPLSMVNLAHGCVPKMCTAFIKRRAGAKAIFDENKAQRSSSQTVPRAMRLRQESSSNDSQLMKLAQCRNHAGRCGLRSIERFSPTSA